MLYYFLQIDHHFYIQTEIEKKKKPFLNKNINCEKIIFLKSHQHIKHGTNCKHYCNNKVQNSSKNSTPNNFNT